MRESSRHKAEESALHPDESALLAHLDGLVAHLREQLPKALRGFEVEAIHQARVATRRLGAATLPLKGLLPERDFKSFRKTLKTLRQILGPHRDTDVLLEHLETLSRSMPERLAAVTRLTGVLSRRKKQLQTQTAAEVGVHRMLGKLSVYEDLRESLAELLRDHRLSLTVARRLTEGVEEGLEEFSSLADLLAHQLEGAEGLTGLDPHELRICGKHLRYSLELAVVAGAPLAKSVLQDFKAMQDALGAWHDMLVLSETALHEVTDAKLLHFDPQSASELLRLSADTAECSAGHLRAFAKLWVQRGPALTEAVLRAMHDGGRRETGPLEGSGEAGPRPKSRGRTASSGRSAGKTVQVQVGASLAGGPRTASPG